VKKAGSASAKSSKLIFETDDIIRAPTIIKAGAVAHPGTKPTIGAKKSETRNSIATTREVNPVFPPWGAYAGGIMSPFCQ
jgi:hypothetical protein